MIANNVIGASNSPTIAQGVPASKEGTGLGELFSLQMLSAFQNMSATDELGVALEGLSEEELKALEEMMALLAQLLSSGQSVPEELMPKMEEKTAAIEQLLGKAQGNADKLSDEWKQLLAKLPQEEPASAKLEKLAALLEALKNQKANGETGKPSASTSAVHLRSEVMAGTNTTQQDAFKAIQPLRVNAGLAAYKQEAGIQAQTVQPSLQAGLLNQDKPGDEGLTFTNAPVVTTTSQAQPGQTFQQPGVQTHQVHANQLPEQVTQLFVNKMNIKQVNGVHEAKLVLNPQSLGQVDVTIKSHNGVITAQFHAETQAAKDMLDNQLPQLRAALTQQGLQVDRLEVNQQQETAFSFQQQREQARQQGKEQEQQKQSEQEFALDALVDNTESTDDLWNRLRETTSGINDIV